MRIGHKLWGVLELVGGFSRWLFVVITRSWADFKLNGKRETAASRQLETRLFFSCVKLANKVYSRALQPNSLRSPTFAYARTQPALKRDSHLVTRSAAAQKDFGPTYSMFEGADRQGQQRRSRI